MATQSKEFAIGDGSLHVGDRVVYPNQGICRITGVETKQIAGQSWDMVTLSREEDGATVMVPRAKVMGVGLRKVADPATIERVFDVLTGPSDGPQLDWKVRHRENADRMSGGGLFGTVEVLKGLHSLARVRPLPAKERELYDSARHLLVNEIAAATDVPLHVAEDNLDYALWPPKGMTRHGKPLAEATLTVALPAPRAATGDDDDLGFEDEALPEAAEKPGADAEGEEEAPPPTPLPAPARARGTRLATLPPPAPGAPSAAAVDSPRPAARPQAPAKAAPKAAPAKPAAAKAPPAKPAAAKAAPAKPAAAKPAAGKAAPAAKKAPPAKKPAGKAAPAKPAKAPARPPAKAKPAAKSKGKK